MDDKEADQAPTLSEKRRIHLGVLTILVLSMVLVAMDPSPISKVLRKLPGTYWTCEKFRICGGVNIGGMRAYECKHGILDMTSCEEDISVTYKKAP